MTSFQFKIVFIPPFPGPWVPKLLCQNAETVCVNDRDLGVALEFCRVPAPVVGSEPGKDFGHSPTRPSPVSLWQQCAFAGYGDVVVFACRSVI